MDLKGQEQKQGDWFNIFCNSPQAEGQTQGSGSQNGGRKEIQVLRGSGGKIRVLKEDWVLQCICI